MVEKRPEQFITEIDYEMYGVLVNKLTNIIKNQNIKFTGVYGVERGGVAIALHLSHNLGIPYLTQPKDGCLICDDIADSGKTLLRISSEFKNIKTATIYYKEKSVIIPEYWLEELADSVWLQFPWEY